MSKLRKFTQQAWVQRLLPFIGALYLRFVYLTSKKVEVNKEYATDFVAAKTHMLGCFWHGRLCMAPFTWKLGKYPVDMLISSHKDGKMISDTIGHLNIGTIEGSTGRGGTVALKKIVSTLKNENSVCYTPDGPRGPRYIAASGGIVAAKLADVPIISVGLSCRFGIRFSSWDHFLLPLPFNKIVMVWGKPFIVPQDAKAEDIEIYQQELQDTLNSLTEQADDICAREHHIDAFDKGDVDET